MCIHQDFRRIHELHATGEAAARMPKNFLHHISDCNSCGHPVVVEIVFAAKPADDNNGKVGLRMPDQGTTPKTAAYTSHAGKCYCEGCGLVYEPGILAAKQ